MGVRSSDRNDQRADVQAVVLDALRRRAAGEQFSDDQVIASRPELAEFLRAELQRLQQICAAGLEAHKQVGSDTATEDHPTAFRTPNAMKLQCPHCREGFETKTDTPVTEIVCSTCGGHFSLIGEDIETRTAPSFRALGHFELVERLGVGGFGTVWKARDRKLDRTVAIKIPRQGMLNNEDLEKFLREARAAAQLQHPNIVRVHEVGHDGESVFIVSDFVRGVTLNDWMNSHKPTPRQAVELCVTIATALQHAHDRGVIHRDLKPANILVDGEGQPHLMDFGLARRQVGEVTLTLDGQILGTPAYMSPEQALGEAHSADNRTDIYSLGVILYQLLTNELPFRGNARMIMHQVIHDEPPSPRRLDSRIPKDLETSCLKCLEKDPKRRYPTAKSVVGDLTLFLNCRPIHARPIGRVGRGIRWVNRNRMTSSLIFLCAAACVAGGAVYYRQATAEQLVKQRQVASALAALRDANERFEQGRSQITDTPRWKVTLDAAENFVRQAEKTFEADRIPEEVAKSLRQQLSRLKIERQDYLLAEAIDDAVTMVLESDGSSNAYKSMFQEIQRRLHEQESFLLGSDVKLVAQMVEQHPRNLELKVLLAAWSYWAPSQDISDLVVSIEIPPNVTNWVFAFATSNPKMMAQLSNDPEIQKLPPGVLVLMSGALRGAGDLNTAIDFLEQKRRRYPDDFWINLRLSNLHLEAKNVDLALRFASSAMAARRDSPRAYMYEFSALMAGKRYCEAALQMESLRISPGLPQSAFRAEAAARAALLAFQSDSSCESKSGPETRSWTSKAIDWLTEEKERLNRVAFGQTSARQNTQETLKRWKSDPVFAPIRDPEFVSLLPEPEQEKCRELWR